MNSRSLPCAGNILAGESSTDDVNMGYLLLNSHLFDIGESLYSRPMLFKNFQTERIYFTLPDRLEAARPL
jgi:hypothetical protein